MTMQSARSSACPDEETLMLFIAKRARDPQAVEAHIDTCASCRMLVAHLAQANQAEQRTATSHSASAFVESLIQEKGVGGGRARPSSSSSSNPALAIGAMVSRYKIERELGRGGMGVVYVAHDPSLDRKIALKVVRPDSDDPNARARIMREARAMARLAHPNVVTIHDVGELPDEGGSAGGAGGQVFLAMELVDGVTLRTVLREQQSQRTLAQMLDLFIQAGHGLAAAHGAGLVHRDFKPDNALVGRDGRVRVMDFGLVRPNEDAGAGAIASTMMSGSPSHQGGALTASGYVLGTPAYMAPEQHLGLATSAQVDQYAFAIAVYEALVGVRPFQGKTHEDIRNAKLSQERSPWPASALNGPGRLPPALMNAIDRALMRDPAHRFPHLNDLIAVLEASRGELTNAPAPVPVVAAPPPPAVQATTTWVDQPAAPQPAPPAPLLRPQPIYRPVRSAPDSSWGLLKYILPIGGLVLFALVLGGIAIRNIIKVKTQPLTAAEERPPVVPIFRSAVLSDGTIVCPPNAHPNRDLKNTPFCMDALGMKSGPSLRLWTTTPPVKVWKHTTYANNKKNGPSWDIDEGGHVTQYEEYVNDKLDGMHLEVDGATGRPTRECHYKLGEPDGVWREWKDGKLTSWMRYENGTYVETKRM